MQARVWTLPGARPHRLPIAPSDVQPSTPLSGTAWRRALFPWVADSYPPVPPCFSSQSARMPQRVPPPLPSLAVSMAVFLA